MNMKLDVTSRSVGFSSFYKKKDLVVSKRKFKDALEQFLLALL